MMTDSKPWQQAATFDDVRGSATNWSLAGDARLLLLMEKISQELISNQSDIQKQINDFQERLTSTAVQLANTENRFNHFANYKFTENRVYDHDVTKAAEAGPEEETKGREERLQEQMPLVRAAISLGLAICEAPESHTSYEGRPLPHLIGSSGFWEDASLGFFKVPESNAAPAPAVDAAALEEPVVDALGPIPGSDTPVTSREPPIANGHMEAPSSSGNLFGAGSESEEEDLFDQKSSFSSSEEEAEEREEEEEKAEARAPRSFSEELSAKLGQPAKPSEPKKSQAKPKKKKKEEKKKEEEEEEEEEEEGDGLFGRKSLFGAGGSLFAESKPEESDDDDLFASKPLPTASKTSTPPVARDEVDAKSAPKPEVNSTSRKFSGPVPPLIESRPPAMGLFDSDEEDDIFRSAPLRSTAPAAGLTESEDDDDLFGPKPSSRPQTSQSVAKKTNASETPKSHTTPSSQPDAASLRSSLVASKAASMFSDDDDDDLFAPKSKAFSKPEPKVEPKVEVKKTEPKAEAKAEAAPSPAKIDPFAFSDDDDEDDDLFSARPPKVITPAKTTATPAAAMAAAAAQQAAALVRQRRPPSSSSEGEEEEEKKEEKKAPQPQPPFSLDKESDDDDDLFSPKKVAVPPQKPKPAPTPSKDKPDLTPSKNKPAPTSSALPKPPFALVDDDEDDDDDDLFSPKKTFQPPQKPEPTPSKEKPSPKPAASALPKPPFALDNEEDEDEDDLFSPKKTVLPPQKPKPSVVPRPTVAQPTKKDPFGFSDEEEKGFSGRGPLLRTASPESESSGWSDQEPLQVKATPAAPKPAAKVDGASGESSTDAKKSKKSAMPPFGARGPSLAEIKARVKNRKSSSSSDEAPPPKKEAPAIDFSQPATATVLPSVLKNRARIQKPRRPPTRRMASSSSTSTIPVAPDSVSSQAAAVQETKKETSPVQSKNQLDFSLDADEDVFANVGKAALKEEEEEKKEKENREREDAEKRQKEEREEAEKKEKEEKERKEEEEKKKKEMEEKEAKEKKKREMEEKEAKENEERKEREKKEEKERREEEEKKEEKEEKAAKLEMSESEDESLRDRPPPLNQNDEDDDLFKDLTISKPRSSPAKEEEKAKDSPKLDADDLDIFAEVGATAKPKKLEDDKRKSESPKPKRAQAAAEDEDIFGSITERASSNKDSKEDVFAPKNSKRGVATDDLFADDTDIFADVPAPKKAEAKQKKSSPKPEEKKKAKKEAKEVAQEDIDDIFSSSPKAAGPKKSKAVSKKDADIFDDPLSA